MKKLVHQVASQNIILCTMAMSRQDLFIHPDSESESFCYIPRTARPTIPQTVDSDCPLPWPVQTVMAFLNNPVLQMLMWRL